MKYADFHAHVALKSLVKADRSVHTAVRYKAQKHKSKRSHFKSYHQADPWSLKHGSVGLTHVTLLPLERFLNDNKFIKFAAQNGHMVVGLKRKWNNRYFRKHGTYRKMLDAEIKQLETVFDRPFGKKNFLIAKKKSDVEQTEKCALVLNVEGMHAFMDTKNYAGPQWKKSIIKSIEDYKKAQYPIFSIGITHFEYNHMVGQSYPFPLPKVLRVFRDLEVPHGKDRINTLGEDAIKLCLKKSSDVGRRILIDIKHASPAVRKQYYDLLEQDFRGENIPILSTHSGVSGFRTIKEAEQSSDLNNAWRSAPLGKFNPWPINLCDEDIKIIYKSGGIIGVEMDQRILGDMRLFGKTDDHKRIIKRLHRKGLDPKKNAHCIMFLQNVFHIVKTIGRIEKEDAWNHICIGSDFDGVIDPIEECPTAFHYTRFLRRCVFVCKNYFNDVECGRYEDFLFGKSLEKALEMLFWENLHNFTVDNFPA